MNWRPISDDAKDGKAILVMGGVYRGLPFPARFDPHELFQERPWLNLLSFNRLYDHCVTHWMPMPEPPETPNAPGTGRS